MPHYDLIVIGSGSGLNVASAVANQLDWKVALVEDGPLGGTCLNRGCIPSKIIIHSAEVAETVKNAAQFGIDAEVKSVDFAAITKRANAIVDEDSAQIEENVQKHPNIDLYKGMGSFAAPMTIQINDQEITGDRVLIAAGTRPSVPSIPGLDQVDYWTSTEALRQTKQPNSLVIIGGGYIGMELGHFYGALGTQITVLEMLDKLLFREDQDIAAAFTQQFAEKYTVHLNAQVTKVAQGSNGQKTIYFTQQDGSETEISAEAILVVAGVKPNTDTLSLENTQIQLTEKGYIAADEYLQTTQEHVWALGDIVGKAPFKHGANYEAQIVLQNMTGTEKVAAKYAIMPHAVFSAPQVAGVGVTEEQAHKQGLHYTIIKYPYTKTGMGQALQAEDAFVKFITDPHQQKILGCHIIGPEASTLIHEVVVVMSATGGNIQAIKNAIHIHPALSEVIQRAL